MKTIFILPLIIIATLLSSCNDDFLNRTPKGRYTWLNYNGDEINKNILTRAKLAQAYSELRSWPFQWGGFAMNNYTTPDVEKGSSPSDGGADLAAFKPLGFTSSNAVINDYYTECYTTIRYCNEALALANSTDTTQIVKNGYLAQAFFLRSVMYYRLAQAFGGVSWVDKVLEQNEKTPARSSREQIWKHVENDLTWAIPYLPTRTEMITSGNLMQVTQNAARAVLAKSYMYEKKWTEALAQTSAIIASGDNNLSTPYADMYAESNEFGPESVFEVYCEEKPASQIYLGSQYGQVQGIRGIPNLGWGFNAPSQVLISAYEPGDPRKVASIISNGDVLEGVTVRADANGYKFFNKKAYARKSERGIFGRATDAQATWMNIRVIRYADVLLMHAEAACELGNMNEALEKLEMVRARARNGNASVLPKVTATNQAELRAKIHFERRIELAMEWERFFDLVRWDETSVMSNFVAGKHELFPIPKAEVDKSGGLITQNPGY